MEYPTNYGSLITCVWQVEVLFVLCTMLAGKRKAEVQVTTPPLARTPGPARSRVLGRRCATVAEGRER